MATQLKNCNAWIWSTRVLNDHDCRNRLPWILRVFHCGWVGGCVVPAPKAAHPAARTPQQWPGPPRARVLHRCRLRDCLTDRVELRLYRLPRSTLAL